MMKKILFIVFLTSSIAYSQKMYSVDYSSQADVKVYVVDYSSQADLKVYKVDYSSQVRGNEGLWFFVDYSSQADKKIYFVEYRSQAGWRNNSKKYLLY